jgi:molybdopterin-guanine dinucleotide biosynthesis protein A
MMNPAILGSSPIVGGPVAGVVLAGGRSSRMGVAKAFALLAGRPLIAHVLDRLRPQTGRLYVNAPVPSDRYQGLGHQLAEDAPNWRGAGPLAGVAAALSLAAAQGYAWLVTAPCDAPFLPLDLVARLAGPLASGAPAAVAIGAGGLEPLFALWPVATLGQVEAALASGPAGPSRVLQDIGAAQVRFESGSGADPFANVNTPEELAAAEAEIDEGERGLRSEGRG